MLHAARALAVLRGRRYVLPSDVHELAPDAMRHRLVLSYRALAEGVNAEAVIGPVLETVPMPRVELVERGGVSQLALLPSAARRRGPAPGPCPRPRCARST